MTIDPIAWLAVANQRRPQVTADREWNPGTVAPSRPDWYERHFTDSMIIEVELSLHFWDGRLWRIKPDGRPHWRQLGDYPAWRETQLHPGFTAQAA
jgi:hypothetical protein